jgi:hypothetical protein
MLKYIKSAATLIDNFNQEYFLHDWSAQNKELYNTTGNNDCWSRCQTEEAGEALTWLQNKAEIGFKPDPNLFRGDMGLAEIFASKVGNTIKLVSDDGTYYIWDEAARRWVHRNNKWIGNEVSQRLEKVIKSRTALLRKIPFADALGEMKLLQKTEAQVLSYRGTMDIVNKVSTMLEDLAFITKINLQPDLLPICAGLVVDLRTGKTSQRLPEHNYTFECPVAIDRDPARLALFEKFMLDICCGDQDLLRYLRCSWLLHNRTSQ